MMKPKLEITRWQVLRYQWMHGMLQALMGRIALIVRREGGFSFCKPAGDHDFFAYEYPGMEEPLKPSDVLDTDTDDEAEAKLRAFVAGLPDLPLEPV